MKMATKMYAFVWLYSTVCTLFTGFVLPDDNPLWAWEL